MNRLNVMHCKLLSMIIKDWYRQYPREMLNTLGKTKLKNFSEYASTMIKKSTNSNYQRASPT